MLWVKTVRDDIRSKTLTLQVPVESYRPSDIPEALAGLALARVAAAVSDRGVPWEGDGDAVFVPGATLQEVDILGGCLGLGQVYLRSGWVREVPGGLVFTEARERYPLPFSRAAWRKEKADQKARKQRTPEVAVPAGIRPDSARIPPGFHDIREEKSQEEATPLPGPAAPAPPPEGEPLAPQAEKTPARKKNSACKVGKGGGAGGGDALAGPEAWAYLPEALAGHDGFRAAWADWIQYRKEARFPRLTPTGLKRIMADLAKIGPDRAAAAIHFSIGKTWQGIFEDRPSGERPPAGGRKSREDVLAEAAKKRSPRP